jgi:hypothetical protein
VLVLFTTIIILLQQSVCVLQALEVQFPVLDVLQPVVQLAKSGELHAVDSYKIHYGQMYSSLHSGPLFISATNLRNSKESK